MTSEAARLARIRDQLTAIAPGEWSRAYDGDGCFVEARGPMGELLPVLRFDAGASEAEIAFATDAAGNVAFLLGLVDRAARTVRDLRSAGRPSSAAPAEGQPRSGGAAREPGRKDYAAECAMKCGEPAFRVFLEQKHGLERPLTDERVAQKARGLLGVVSRAELNNGGQAAERWKALRGDFEAWRRAGR